MDGNALSGGNGEERMSGWGGREEEVSSREQLFISGRSWEAGE